MNEAIKKAIEGGYEVDTFFYGHNGFYPDHIFLDPIFWQCLGKKLGWGYDRTWSFLRKKSHTKEEAKRVAEKLGLKADWLYHWHDFIEHLAEGKSRDDFFTNLLTQK